MDLNQVTIPALDVTASVAFYQNMGFALIVEARHYARFRSTVGGATFSVHAVDSLAETPKSVVYFECATSRCASDHGLSILARTARRTMVMA
jgi:hypothetical protein